MEMKKYKLDEIAEIQTGPFGSQLHNDDYVLEGTPIVTVEHLGNKYFTTQNLPLVSEADKQRLKKYILKENDIVFSRVGSVDRCSFVSKNEDGWLFSGRCLRVRPNSRLANAEWLYYFFTQSYFKEYVRSKAVGCTMPSLNTDLLSELNISLPSFETQQKIAAVLSSLDDKIALNRRMNAKLEHMAKRLYDHWFVQFDFPNADGKPYKASGGKMVWNETLKREIPDGWEVKKLGELFTTNRGVSYSTKTITGDAGIPMINLASFSPDGSYKIDGIKLYTGDYTKEKVLKPFDLVMCNTQQTAIDFSKDIIGKALLVPNIFEGDITSSHHVNTLKVHDEKLKFYLYRVFNTDYFHAYISHFASGTNIMGLDFAGVESYTAIIPNEEILKKFAEFTLNIEKKKSEIIRENTKLISLRDRLLPLLMNGQVEVE